MNKETENLELLADPLVRINNKLFQAVSEGLKRYKENPNDEFLKYLLPFLSEIREDVLTHQVDVVEFLNLNDEIVLDNSKRMLDTAKNDTASLKDEIDKLNPDNSLDNYTPTL